MQLTEVKAVFRVLEPSTVPQKNHLARHFFAFFASPVNGSSIPPGEQLRQGKGSQKQFDGMKMIGVEVGIADKTKMEGNWEGVCLIFIGSKQPACLNGRERAARQILDTISQ